MARKTRSVKGGVTYFKRPYVLSYKDGSPTVYKIQICRGRVVKDADFIAYAANAAHVPESTMVTARHAILEAINYFVLNGSAQDRLICCSGKTGRRTLLCSISNLEHHMQSVHFQKWQQGTPSCRTRIDCRGH